jgi:hypothetical protein
MISSTHSDDPPIRALKHGLRALIRRVEGDELELLILLQARYQLRLLVELLYTTEGESIERI